eukprot:g1674.t1
MSSRHRNSTAANDWAKKRQDAIEKAKRLRAERKRGKLKAATLHTQHPRSGCLNWTSSTKQGIRNLANLEEAFLQMTTHAGNHCSNKMCMAETGDIKGQLWRMSSTDFMPASSKISSSNKLTVGTVPNPKSTWRIILIVMRTIHHLVMAKCVHQIRIRKWRDFAVPDDAAPSILGCGKRRIPPVTFSSQDQSGTTVLTTTWIAKNNRPVARHHEILRRWTTHSIREARAQERRHRIVTLTTNHLEAAVGDMRLEAAGMVKWTKDMPLQKSNVARFDNPDFPNSHSTQRDGLTPTCPGTTTQPQTTKHRLDTENASSRMGPAAQLLWIGRNHRS